MSNPKAKRRAKPPQARWTTVPARSQFLASYMPTACNLEVARLTEQEKCRARNLKNAKRVRGQLRELIPQVRFGALMRHCVCVKLDSLDARRAALNADVWAQALSLMYPMGTRW